MRLIDADALMNDNVWLCGGFVGDAYSDGYMDALDKVETVIRELPTVDAIPVAWLMEKLVGHPEIPYSVSDGIIAVLNLWEGKDYEM